MNKMNTPLLFLLQGAASEWRVVFMLTAGIFTLGCLVYVIFTTAEEADWSRDLMGKSWVSQVSEHVSEWAGMLPGSGSSPVGNPFAGLLDRPVGNPFAGMQVPSMPDPFAAVGVRNPFVAAPVAERGTAPAAAPSSSK